ncbi:MAG TPA: SBBP repeat-containing protein, partial [Bacteroidales bacterium]|nr:SBBP repeat-containing protein [Bacteroidales bacterium]
MKPRQLNAPSPGLILFYGFLLISLITLEYYFSQVFEKKSSHASPDQPVISSYGPRIRFEKNAGQTDPQVAFLCRGRNHILYLTSTGSVMHLNGDDENLNTIPLQMEILDANPDAKGKGLNQLVSRSNYFRGNDPGQWITDVPNYDRVGFEDIYKNIDLIYYINDNEVEFDFMVKPGAKPEMIRMNFSGVEKVKINRNGDLIVHAGGHKLVYRKPLAWQTIDGSRHHVDVQFALAEKNEICFNTGKYNNNETLIIDPQVVYSTYLGGSETESGYAIAVDAEGCAYVTGSTTSTDFPTFSSFQSELTPGMFSNLSDIFVTKFNAAGTDIVFSTYIGGNWGDEAKGIAIDGNNYIYLTGTTWSKDDPTTQEDEGFPLMSAYQSQIGDNNFSDAFITVLTNTGSALYYSTYFGGDGEDTGEDIAVSIDGYAFITGVNFSFYLPMKNAFLDSKPSYYYDAYVAKFNPHTSGENSLVYSTYLGGNYDDYGYAIAVDRYGCAYVTGTAKSTDFPTTPDPIQGERKVSSDIFVTKFSADGLSLDYSTYLGSDGSDEGKDIEVDSAGCAYVCGYGRDGFPTTPGAFITSGGYSILSKLLADGSGFIYSTHVPISGRIAVDDMGQVYIASSLARMVGEVVKSDAYIVAINSAGSDTLFTLTLGGSEGEGARDIAVDKDRSLYITGTTSSADFPVENAYQIGLGGKSDVFVAKIGVPKEELIVKVLQDPLNHNPEPMPNTSFDIYLVDLTNIAEPYAYFESRATDDNGLLHLPT